ncbi:unnamed protein product [Closterium sp. Yama58-4]|nr:unnamed protein product [Closterium sp. Yama58-4]
MTITCSREEEPLGTAGPLALAKNILLKSTASSPPQPFFMLNSDVICDYPFKGLLDLHISRGAEATLMVTRVEDPSKYGVVIMDDAGAVSRFVEKPKTFVGDTINGGIYILSPSVLERVELRPMSIEKDIFPRIAMDKKLYAMVHTGYWMDVGQPKDYLEGIKTYLHHKRSSHPGMLATGSNIVGNVIVDPSATISKSASVGPDVVVGPNCIIHDGARIHGSVLLGGSRIGSGSLILNSIIGWNSTVGKWTRIQKNSVLGEDVTVNDEVLINGAKVLPHKEVKADVDTPQIIM